MFLLLKYVKFSWKKYVKIRFQGDFDAFVQLVHREVYPISSEIKWLNLFCGYKI